MNHFTFNGHSTGDFGLLVTGLSTYGSPARRVEKISVPGRNGDVLLDEGTFDNYIARYQIAIINNFKVNAREIANWLLSSRGYSELTDTYNPETYRMASFYSNIDYVVTALSREGTATIEFDCKPQRYFYTNAPITFTANAYNGTIEDGNIPNTAEAPLSLSLKGNTAQDGTPTPSAPIAVQSVSGDNVITVCGKNVQPNVCEEASWVGCTLEMSGEALHYYGTATGSGGRTAVKLQHIFLNAGTYSLSANIIANNGTNLPDMIVQKVEGTTFTTLLARNLSESGRSFTLTDTTEIALGFNCTNGGVYDVYFNIQIEKGSATAYEPYTAQDYPINLPVENYFDINSAYADTSKFTISGETVVGNIGDFNNARVYVPGSLIGKEVTFQAEIATVETTTWVGVEVIRTGSVKLTGTHILTGRSGKSYVTFTPQTGDRVYLTYGSSPATQTISNIMLTIGGVKETYWPYGTPSIELNKIGSYADYFHQQDGSWYLHKSIGKAVFDGSEAWYRQTESHTNIINLYVQVSGLGAKEDLLGYSDIATFSSSAGASNDTTANVCKFNSQRTNYLVDLSLSEFSSVSAFETYLSTHNMEMYYVLTTATETLIEDTTLINQLNAIAEATSYKGSTNIAQTNNDLPFNLDVTAMTSGTLTAEHNAEPIITVNSPGSLYVNGNYLKVLSAPITINSKTMQAYSGTVLKNNDVEGDFPYFTKGNNEVSSDVDLTIIPNYWEL